MLCWPSTDGISNPLPMVYWTSCLWYFDPQWYKNSLSMVFWPLSMVYRIEHLPVVLWPSTLVYIEPLSMVFWPPTHGISYLLSIVYWSSAAINDISNHLTVVFWPHTHGISNHLQMVSWPHTLGISNFLSMVFGLLSQDISKPAYVYFDPYQCYIEPLAYGIPMVYQNSCIWYIEPLLMAFLSPTHGISKYLPMVYWSPVYGISNSLTMVYWNPFLWCFTLLPISNHCLLYSDVLTHGISNLLHMVFWPLTHGILIPYPWYIDPLPMVHWSPTHGILTHYPWYIDPLPMVYWMPCSWYIKPPAYGKRNPMPCWPP